MPNDALKNVNRDLPQTISRAMHLSSSGVSDPSLSKRILGLDELRGLSVLWVMLCHGTGLTTWIPTPFAGYGFHGVVLFFLLSGYLITRILLESRSNSDYFSRFYINRFFRIWPLMLLALLVSAIIWPEYARSGVTNLLLVNNYASAVGIEPAVRTDVMWSLAIEEQFYLFWPVLVWMLPRKLLPYTTSAIVILGLAFDAHLLPAGAMITSKTTHATMQYIAMGALIAYGRDSIKWLLSCWAIFIGWWILQRGISAISDFRWIWYGVTFILALISYYTIEHRPLIRNRWLAEIGKLCYGLYIIHFFVSALASTLFGRGEWKAAVTYVVVSFALSIISFWYFELPVQKIRTHLHRSEKLRVALFTSLAFMALVSIIYIVTTSKF